MVVRFSPFLHHSFTICHFIASNAHFRLDSSMLRPYTCRQKATDAIVSGAEARDNMAERKQLAAARIQRHWTLEVAAERLGVGVNTLCRWEKGKVVPQAYHILKLEEVYGIPATELGLIATTVNDAVGR